jgi:hypothetical protein
MRAQACSGCTGDLGETRVSQGSLTENDVQKKNLNPPYRYRRLEPDTRTARCRYPYLKENISL